MPGILSMTHYLLIGTEQMTNYCLLIEWMVPSNNHANNESLPENWLYQTPQSLQWLHNKECFLTSTVVWKYHSRKLYANRSLFVFWFFVFPLLQNKLHKIFQLGHCTLVKYFKFWKALTPLLMACPQHLACPGPSSLVSHSWNATAQVLSHQQPCSPKPVTLCSRLLITNIKPGPTVFLFAIQDSTW